MRQILIKWGFVTVILFGFTVSCAKPTLVPKSATEKWTFEEREAENFVFVDYHWNGGKFDDAVQLEKDISVWAKQKEIFVYAMGRYPTGHDWQLGFVASKAPEEKVFQGRTLKNAPLAAGRYAKIDLLGHTDHMFYYWKKFKKWLEKDGLTVDSPTIEVYPDIFTKEMTDKTSDGWLRYHIADAK